MAVHTYQLVISGRCAGQFCQNVFHYEFDDAGYANSLAAAKGLIDGFIAGNRDDLFLDMLPAQYVILSLKARAVSGGIGPEWIDQSMSGNTGTRGSGIVASSDGPVLIWYQEDGPRKNGRTFLAGIYNGDVEGGEINAAALSAILAKANSFRGTFNTVGGGTPATTMVVQNTSNPAAPYTIVDVNISKHLGQQRRRQVPV